MSRRDKAAFLERMFSCVFTQLTLISEPFFFLVSACSRFLKNKYVTAFLVIKSQRLGPSSFAV